MTFKDAYDLKELAADYKAAGIPVAEEAVVATGTIFLSWIEKSAAKSTEGFLGAADDVVAKGVPALKEALAKLADLNKDGKIGV